MGRYESRIGYRAGPVEGKTEYICQFTGGSRSTGYHGTGYYFCKDWKNCAGLNHGERPLYKLTFKPINWFRGDLETHSLLKKIQSFVVNYPILKSKETLDNYYWLVKHGADIKGYDMDEIDSIKDRYNFDKSEYDFNNFSEWLSNYNNHDVEKFIEDIHKIPELKEMWELFMEDEPDWEAIKRIKENHRWDFDYDYIDGMRDLRRKLELELPFNFDVEMEEFLGMAEKLYSYYERNKNKQEDSIPTKFLKMLGFEGVWPSNEIDDTTYGGVVFEKDSIEKIELLSEFAKDFKESKTNTKYNMRKIRENYDPEDLQGLIDVYRYDYSPETHEKIWNEIVYAYKDEDLANDVLAALEDGVDDEDEGGWPGIYESKDYKYKAQIGNQWLKKSGKGYKLVKNKSDADIFESETEPRQIFNQMKKDGEIEKGAKIKFSKLKESFDFEDEDDLGYDDFDYEGEMEEYFNPNINEPYEDYNTEMWSEDYERDISDTGIPTVKPTLLGKDSYNLSKEHLDMIETDWGDYEKGNTVYGDDLDNPIEEIDIDPKLLKRGYGKVAESRKWNILLAKSRRG